MKFILQNFSRTEKSGKNPRLFRKRGNSVWKRW